MKKNFLRALLFVAAIVCLLLICCVSASADEYSGACGDSKSNITWKLNTDLGILQISGNGSLSDYAISGTRVAPWSEHAKHIRTVTVGTDISELGKYAFANCDKLEVITFSDKITTLPEGLFYGCSSLESINIGRAVTDINNTAFYGCGGLKNITVSEENEKYGLVDGCLVEIDTNTLIRSNHEGAIPESVTVIANGALSGCNTIDKLIVPKTIEWIGYGAFANCNSLTQITLPFVGACRVSADGNEIENMQNSQTLFGYAFGEAGVPESLKTVVINDTEMICDGAFAGCKEIVKIGLSEGVITIGENAFSDCTKLSEFIVPGSVKTIGKRAFYNCVSLSYVKIIEDELSSIGKGAFANCKSLKDIIISGVNTTYRVEGKCLIDKNNMLVFGCNESVIPQGITAIADEAFYGCNSLSLTAIPTGVVSIGNSAFFGCSGLLTIELPDTLKTVGDYAFADCTGLTYVGIPDTVEKYGDSVFANCTSLKSPGMPYTESKPRPSGCSCSCSSTMIAPMLALVALMGVAWIGKSK